MAIVGAIAVPHPPLIVPSVGRGEQLRIQATVDAYGQAADGLLALEPDAVVVISPHAPLLADAFHVTTDPTLDGSMARFRARHERISARCDVELAHEIRRRAGEAGMPTVGSRRRHDEMDHATFVPLRFVREAHRRRAPQGGADLPCPIVRIGLSCLPPQAHRAFGRAIARAAESLGRAVGLIASGDLSHKLLAEGPYGFAPEGPIFDREIGRIFASGELDGLFELDGALVEAAAECGLRSFQMMAGAIEGLGLDIRMLSNEGPFGVGYCVATCLPRDGVQGPGAGMGGAGRGDPHIALARLAVETFVATGRPPALPGRLPPSLAERKAGVFVSLHKGGRLRGCIGTIAATCDSVAQEIVRNGIDACSRDPRFEPVRPDELDQLEYSVDVLGDVEPVDSPDSLDPKRYGVVVTKGRRRGLLLPDIDGVDTVGQQLAIARRKAGISPAEEGVVLERFEVTRHTRGGGPRRP